MSDLKFIQTLIVGSYGFTAGCYLFGFFILRSLWRIEKSLVHDKGVEQGQDHERRITRLERQAVTR